MFPYDFCWFCNIVVFLVSLFISLQFFGILDSFYFINTCQTMPLIGKKRVSKVWKYFKFNDESSVSSKCLICLEVIINRGNTTNLISYLKRKHAMAYEDYLSSLMEINELSQEENINNLWFWDCDQTWIEY